jgi:adenine-specific DNA-methyltransferase
MTDQQLLEFNPSDVFTPDSISKRMSLFLHGDGTLLEPAVGKGHLLKFINIDSYSIDVFDIKQKYLDECDQRFMKYNTDFIFHETKKRYKNIILNPPFIRFQDLSIEYRRMLKDRWKILSGNVDIYYAFLLKCIEVLDEEGVMVAITPNSYIYNKSAKNMREYFLENRLIQEIVDFKSEKVFKNISAYCCITVFSKTKKESFIYNDAEIRYDTIGKDYSIFGNANSGKTLVDICTIKNGIATLRDKIYIHSSKKYEEPCWKEIVVNANKNMWVIHPYEDGVIIDEKRFKKDNPKTYAFLEENKGELAKRDKGHKTYREWYAFGRTQSLVPPKSEKVLYIPTFGDPNSVGYRIDDSKLFVGCLCLELTTDEYSLEEVVEILIKNKDFIEKNSLKRGGGWISISGTLLKKINLI